ncbi:MAG: aspartate-semialdehyde dehydrogenase, partial [Chloroflexota bacterium]
CKSYRQALTDADSGGFRWYCDQPPADAALALEVRIPERLDLDSLDVIFSAVEADDARRLEPGFAARVPVVSTASAFRMSPDMPIFVSTINAGHARLIDQQRKSRGWKGFITPQPNCTTIGLATTLKPVYDRWGLRAVIMTSMQALSGAGRSGGVLGLDILDNVIPYIPKEEEKVEQETQKVLGELAGDSISPARFAVSCTCTRVNVLEGHTEAVFVSMDHPANAGEVKAAMAEYRSGLEDLGLPSAPTQLIWVMEDPFRPQPRLDRDIEDGMATAVGRVRPDQALENGMKWVLVSHNTKNGAARGAVLVAELLSKQGYIG